MREKKNCKRGFKCREDSCQKKHHQLLHEAYIAGHIFHSKSNRGIVSSLLQLQVITGGKRGGKKCPINVFWDSGSTMSFITFQRAMELNLVGKLITLEIFTVGGETKSINSKQYDLVLID